MVGAQRPPAQSTIVRWMTRGRIARDIPRTVTCTCGATCGFRLEIIVIVTLPSFTSSDTSIRITFNQDRAGARG